MTHMFTSCKGGHRLVAVTGSIRKLTKMPIAFCDFSGPVVTLDSEQQILMYSFDSKAFGDTLHLKSKAVLFVVLITIPASIK